MCVTTHKYKSGACGLGSCVADGRISLSGLSTAAEVFAKVREAVACSHQSVSRTRTERLSDDARTEESRAGAVGLLVLVARESPMEVRV